MNKLPKHHFRRGDKVKTSYGTEGVVLADNGRGDITVQDSRGPIRCSPEMLTLLPVEEPSKPPTAKTLYAPSCDCGSLEPLATFEGHDYCQSCLIGELKNRIAVEKVTRARILLQGKLYAVITMWPAFQAKYGPKTEQPAVEHAFAVNLAAGRVGIFETDPEPDPSAPASMPLLQLPPVTGLTIMPSEFERRAVKVIFSQAKREAKKEAKRQHDFWNDPINQVRKRQYRANIRPAKATEGQAPIMLFEASPQIRRDGAA